MTTLQTVNVSFHFPGQAIESGPNTLSLTADQNLEEIVNKLSRGFEETVGKEKGGKEGKELVKAVLESGKDVLTQNTLVAQLKSHLESTTMWLGFLKYRSTVGEPSAEELIQQGLLRIQLAGHSFGTVPAHMAPGPGHLDDQVGQFMLTTKVTLLRGGLMLGTDHDYNLGGMAVIVGLPAWRVNRLAKKVNRQLGQGDYEFVQLVLHNAPKIKGVAGPREGLEMMDGLVTSNGGKFYANISPYWFHHTGAMQNKGKLFGLQLGKIEGIANWTPSPHLEHVSYVTGEVISAEELLGDMAQGIYHPVFYYTFRGASVHGAAHKKGFYDAIVLNREIQRWFRTSKYMATHLMTDLTGIAEAKEWLMRVMNGELQHGKARQDRHSADVPKPAYKFA